MFIFRRLITFREMLFLVFGEKVAFFLCVLLLLSSFFPPTKEKPFLSPEKVPPPQEKKTKQTSEERKKERKKEMALEGASVLVKSIVTDTYYLAETLYKAYQAVVPSEGGAVEEETRKKFLERLKRFKENTNKLTQQLQDYAATNGADENIVSTGNLFGDAIIKYKALLKVIIEPRSPPDAETKKNMKATYDLVFATSNDILRELGALREKKTPVSNVTQQLQLPASSSVPLPGDTSMPVTRTRSKSGGEDTPPPKPKIIHKIQTPEKRATKSSYEGHNSTPLLGHTQTNNHLSHSQSVSNAPSRSGLASESPRDGEERVSLEDIQGLAQECKASVELLSKACEHAVRGETNSAIEGLKGVMMFLKDMNRIAKSLGLDLQCDMLQRLSSEMVISIKTTLKQGADADCFEKVLKNKEGTTRHIHLLLRDINTEFQRQQEQIKQKYPHDRKTRPVSLIFAKKPDSRFPRIGSEAHMSSLSPSLPTSPTASRGSSWTGSGPGSTLAAPQHSPSPTRNRGRSPKPSRVKSMVPTPEQKRQINQWAQSPQAGLSGSMGVNLGSMSPKQPPREVSSGPRRHEQSKRRSNLEQKSPLQEEPQGPPALPPVLLDPKLEEAAKKILEWYRIQRRRNFWLKSVKFLLKDSSTKKLRKKRETFKEVIGSEMTYVKGLEQCVKIVMGGLKEEKIWKDQQYQDQMVEKIFLNYAEVAKLSRTLLDKLLARDKEFPKKVKLGDIFLEMMDDFLKQYAIYVQGYYQTVAFIDTIENKKWEAYLKKKRDEAKKPLVSLLILPVQRLPRYEMLLEQIYDLTPAEHVDKENLRLAVKFVKEMNEDIDRQTQNRNKLLSVEKLILGCPNIVQLDRYFIRQGSIQGEKKRGGKRLNYYVFLFNNMLLLTSPLEKPKKEGEKYEFVEELKLPEYELQDFYYDKEKFQLALVKKDPIKKKEKDEPQPVTLFSEMKENWMIDIGTWTARTVSVTDRS